MTSKRAIAVQRDKNITCSYPNTQSSRYTPLGPYPLLGVGTSSGKYELSGIHIQKIENESGKYLNPNKIEMELVNI